MTYHEREQYIFDHLSKDIDTTNIYFSLRKNGNANARRDIFIGTKESKYFNFSLWDIPIGFAGSSGNFLDFSLFEKSENIWSFRFSSSIPKNVSGDQNKLSLKFLKQLVRKIDTAFPNYKNRHTQEHNRIAFLNIDSPTEFSDFKKLYPALLEFINKVSPFIDSEISSFQIENPEWKAQRIDKKGWEKFNSSYQRRLQKYPLEIVEEEEEHLGEDIIELINPTKSEHPCNQILYGPPGTGKTYRSIELALDILGVEIKNRTRIDLVEEYENLRKKGKIAFTTFHQSMSYEDFIEGIKPTLDDLESELSYEIKDGILKSMSKLATQEYVKWSENESVSFGDKYNRLLDLINESESGYTLKSKTGSKLILKEVTAKDNINVSHENGNRNYIVSKTRLEKVFHGISDLKNISNINKAIRNLIGGSNATAYWAVNEFLHNMEDEKSSYEINYQLTDLQLETIIRDINWQEASQLNVDRYVIIIDEINRGNVSGIFGELITLLEDDKRLDKTNRIVLKLPYSKIDFGLTSNLYIIGTMNTADRSVEALDTALRRRFSFKEVQPDTKVISGQSEEEGSDDIDGVNLVHLLETINQRITLLIDKDHTIGHSYFLGIHELEGLKETFKNKIIPLLQEYFYNDYGKLEKVLGKGFIARKRIDNKSTVFAGNSNDIDIDLPDFEYQLIPINKDFDILNATRYLLNLPEESASEN